MAHRGPQALSASPEPAILADGGGSNSSTARAWKLRNIASATATACASPWPASKWNPIEHRLFCEISKLRDQFLNYLRTTRTSTGLRVRAHLVRKTYKTGVKVTDAQMRELRITPNRVMPKWNYTSNPLSEKTAIFAPTLWLYSAAIEARSDAVSQSTPNQPSRTESAFAQLPPRSRACPGNEVSLSVRFRPLCAAKTAISTSLARHTRLVPCVSIPAVN